MRYWPVLLSILVATSLVRAENGPSSDDAAQIISQRWARNERFGSYQEISKQLGKFLELRGLKEVRNREVNQRAGGLVKQVAEVYRRLYPDWLASKQDPQVLVTNGRWSDAMNWSDAAGETYKGVLILPLQLISGKNMSPSVRTVLIAHEMAHFFLFHSGNPRAILSATDLRTGKPISKERFAALEDVLSLAQVAGPFANVELENFPLDGSALKLITEYTIGLYEHLAQKKEIDCLKQLLKAMPADLQYPYEFIDVIQGDLVFTKSNGQEVRRRISNLKNLLLSCSAKVGHKSEVLTRDDGGPGMSDEKFIRQVIDKDYSWSPENELEMIFKIAEVAQKEMRKLTAEYELKFVYWRSTEDEADEFAVTVARAMGLDAREFGRAMFKAARKEWGDAEVARCEASIRAGTLIPPGYLSDPHHVACFRHKRIMDMMADPHFRAEP